MSRLFREPLVHFLALGLGLFLLFDWVNDGGESADSKLIRVDRQALLTFLQYRSRSFEPRIAAARLNEMSQTQLDILIAEHVREEALYREALALGMDKNDYIIKQRLIQSIEFITNGFVTAAVELTDEDVAAYYQANRENYRVEPFVTFTHVFFGTEQRSRADALELANAKLAELNRQNTPFNAAPRHGDRFMYALNYVEREIGFVAGHFGQAMAEAIFALDPSETTWRGPLESPYGFHLLLLPRKAPGRYPALAEIQTRVRGDAERDAIAAQQEAAIQAIVDTYRVERRLDSELVGAAQ